MADATERRYGQHLADDLARATDDAADQVDGLVAEVTRQADAATVSYVRLPNGVEWERITKFDPRGAALADRHYNRRKVGSPQWMPPGETLNLLTPDGRALWGWWRPHPASGLKQMNNLDGWTCTIFRNETDVKSSLLILAAELALVALDRGCGPDGMLTYVWDSRVESPNPGYCFKMAGWEPIGRSADGRKTLLRKPFELAGVDPSPSCYGPDGKGCFIPHDCDGKCSWAPWMQEVAA